MLQKEGNEGKSIPIIYVQAAQQRNYISLELTPKITANCCLNFKSMAKHNNKSVYYTEPNNLLYSMEEIFRRIFSDSIPFYYDDFNYEKLLIISTGPVSEQINKEDFVSDYTSTNKEYEGWYAIDVYGIKDRFDLDNGYIKLFTIKFSQPESVYRFEINTDKTKLRGWTIYAPPRFMPSDSYCEQLDDGELSIDRNKASLNVSITKGNYKLKCYIGGRPDLLEDNQINHDVRTKLLRAFKTWTINEPLDSFAKKIFDITGSIISIRLSNANKNTKEEQIIGKYKMYDSKNSIDVNVPIIDNKFNSIIGGIKITSNNSIEYFENIYNNEHKEVIGKMIYIQSSDKEDSEIYFEDLNGKKTNSHSSDYTEFLERAYEKINEVSRKIEEINKSRYRRKVN